MGAKEIFFFGGGEWVYYGNRPVHPSLYFGGEQGCDFQSVHVVGLHQMTLNTKTHCSQEDTC